MRDRLAEYHEDACADLVDLGVTVENLLRALLDSEGIKPHSVTHRIKAEDSARRKLSERGGDPEEVEELHDLLGLRIITFFPDEVDKVASLIPQEFEIDVENSVDKRALLDPDRFGYLSLHYVMMLNTARSALVENTAFAGRKFELQIRSILQHAWAEIEHDLGYHSPSAIPDALRRRFSRLAGMLEVADDEFERLRDDVVSHREAVQRDVKKAPSEVPLDRDSVAALISSDPLLSELEEEFVEIAKTEMQAGHERVPDARYDELQALGFDTAGEVLDSLRDHRDLLIRFFRVWSVKHEIRYVYPGMSLFFLGYLHVAEIGSRAKIIRYLREAHIGDDDADRAALASKLRATLKQARELADGGPA